MPTALVAAVTLAVSRKAARKAHARFRRFLGGPVCPGLFRVPPVGGGNCVQTSRRTSTIIWTRKALARLPFSGGLVYPFVACVCNPGKAKVHGSYWDDFNCH